MSLFFRVNLALVLLISCLSGGAQAQLVRLPPTLPAANATELTNGGRAPQRREIYFDHDRHGPPVADRAFLEGEPFDWILFPEGLIYRPYLAGPKEPRFSAQIIHDSDVGLLWDGNLGTQVGLLRYGNRDPIRPLGFQIDAEGAAQVRLEIPNDVDVRSADFRGGLPITFSNGCHRTKFAFYHLSSHLGDEFLLDNPGFKRLNYSRDALVLGHSIYFGDSARVYAETGWAFKSEISEPWEFQFGFDWSPARPTGVHGAPFFAANAHLREEVNFGGGLTVQAGWAWVGDQTGRALRGGLHYYNGKSNQFSFFDMHEQQIGFGVWFDM